MELHYTLTFDDFSEASEWTRIGGRPPAKQPRGRMTLVALAFGAFFLYGFVPMVYDKADVAYEPSRNLWFDLIPTLAPALGFVCYFLLSLWLQYKRLSDSPDGRQENRRQLLVFAYTVPVMLIGLLAFELLKDPVYEVKWTPRRRTVVIMVLGVWIAVFLLYSIYGCIYGALSDRLSWQRAPVQRGPKRVTLGEGGVDVHSEGQSSHYDWAAYAFYRETDSLLLLYESVTMFLVLPKRALADESALDALQSLIAAHVTSADRKPAPRGFAVLPFAAKAETGESETVALAEEGGQRSQD